MYYFIRLDRYGSVWRGTAKNTKTENRWQGLVERFAEKKQSLQQHPDVVITHYSVGEPAIKSEIALFEEYAGVPLPSELREFYSLANGLTLRWVNKTSPSGQEELEKHQGKDIGYFTHDYFYPPECINILPIGQLFTERWETNYDNGMGKVDLKFCFVLDRSNFFSRNLGFLFAVGESHPIYGYDDDHFACFYTTPRVTFEDHIYERVLQKWTEREIEATRAE
ncbi:MAG: hypothetical protein AAF518_21610 [Spirochaetota bacterium]